MLRIVSQLVRTEFVQSCGRDPRIGVSGKCCDRSELDFVSCDRCPRILDWGLGMLSGQGTTGLFDLSGTSVQLLRNSGAGFKGLQICPMCFPSLGLHMIGSVAIILVWTFQILTLPYSADADPSPDLHKTVGTWSLMDGFPER